jgi:NADH-quinone oxidoreductase subunit M
MNFWDIPWVEVTIALPIAGALWVAGCRTPGLAFRSGVVVTAATLIAAALAWLDFGLRRDGAIPAQNYWHGVFGQTAFQVDELSAPLLPLIALLYFLTIVSTARTKMGRFSFTWSLVSEALQLAAFGCKEPWLLVGLLAAGTMPPFIVLKTRDKPTRVYAVHMLLFVLLLVVGRILAESGGDAARLATVPLLAAILVRCGTFPAHCWITDWFEHSSFGNALLFVAPLTGVYAAVRLVLPIAPDWVLQGIGVVSLATAVYAAAMATIQQEARRFFAFLFISHSALVLVGLEFINSISITGALSLWFSVTLALGGLGLTLRAVEARVGRLSLAKHHGLYEASPALAACFLLTGLASVGFPGTLGFVAMDMVIDGAIEANLYLGVGAAVAAALNGIAVVRIYFLVFTGARHVSTVSLRMGLRERFALLTLTALILIGGIVPQPGVAIRHSAAEAILKDRAKRGAENEMANSELARK